LNLNLPLCEAAYKRFRPNYWGTAIFLVPLLAWAFCVPIFAEDVGFLLGIAFCGFLLWSLVQIFWPKRLRFERVRHRYLWLAGAGPEFLNQLPPWTARQPQ
jgi:hypothetical protein